MDNITLTAKNDKIICEFIRMMYNSKGGIEHHKQSEIRNNAREVAWLLIECRKASEEENYTVEDMINPMNYNDVLDAVKKVTGYNGAGTIIFCSRAGTKVGTPYKILFKSCSENCIAKEWLSALRKEWKVP